MFRTYKVILRPYKKTAPRAVYVSLHCGIPSASKFCFQDPATAYCINITKRGKARGEIERVNSPLSKYDLVRYIF